MSGTERFEAIDAVNKKLVAEFEKDDHYRCSVINFLGALEHLLFKQLAIRDVRLVHAPTASIKKFGCDIDNWIWQLRCCSP